MLWSCCVEDVDFKHLPEPVQKLHYGVAHYSKSFFGDFWVAVKNKHAVLGIFLAHPNHTFSTLERIVALALTLAVAAGLCFAWTAIMALGLNEQLNLMQEEALEECDEMEDCSDVPVRKVPEEALQQVFVAIFSMIVQIPCAQRSRSRSARYHTA